MIDIAFAIIAGGKSSRYGRSKLAAEFRGKRLIDYAVNNASTISDKVMIIANEQNVPNQVGRPIYNDIFPNCGPVGGIYTALINADTKWVAVMPVDMPLLSPRIYEFLLTFVVWRKPVAACSHSGLETMVSLWPISVASSMEQLLLSGERRAWKVFEQLGGLQAFLPHEMPDYNEKWFANINTPNDLQMLES